MIKNGGFDCFLLALSEQNDGRNSIQFLDYRSVKSTLDDKF
jgi:hypothetical protein